MLVVLSQALGTNVGRAFGRLGILGNVGLAAAGAVWMRYAIDLAFEVSESPKPPSTVDVALLYVPAMTNSPPWAGITEPGVQVLLQVAPVLQTCVLAWSAWTLGRMS